MSIKSVIPSNDHILCHPLLLASIISSIRVFSNEQLFISGGWSIGTSTLTSILPMHTQDWFPLVVTGLISLLSKGLSIVFSNTIVWRHQFFSAQPFILSSSHTCKWLLKKNNNFDYMDFISKGMSLLFNTLSRCAIAFLPSSKHLIISWLQSPSAVILEPKKM